MSICYNEKRIQSLQGGVKVPTGGYSPRASMRQVRCDSGADGTVRMKEEWK